MAKRRIFVFGSNTAGRHGKGAAKTAVRRYGAVYGQGKGLQGNSYAIPTKNERLQRLKLSDIRANVLDFLVFAWGNPGLIFDVTRIGCGEAGYSDEQIGPMFARAPENCRLPGEWECFLPTDRRRFIFRRVGEVV